jgi:hypothetical protein
MPELGKSGEVETGFNEKFEQGWWRVERTAWAVMTVLVMAGALGVFGRGYASRGGSGSSRTKKRPERGAQCGVEARDTPAITGRA